MNETLRSIMSRRSIRSFTDDSVCESTMKLVLAAGAAAPSACGVFPVRFVVLDKKRMAALAETVVSAETAETVETAVPVDQMTV